MFAKIHARFCGNVGMKSCRFLTTSEAATALRPFYFLVHPDLFGQHPKERLINEDSLKKLNQYITLLQRSGIVKATNVTFYLRQKDSILPKTGLPSVKLTLSSDDLRTVVTSILKTCGLPLDFLNATPVKLRSSPHGSTRPIRWDPSYAIYKDQNPLNVVKKKKQTTLLTWLEKNLDRAKKLDDVYQLTIEDIKVTSAEIQHEIELMDLRWESDWGHAHFMSCLQSFNRFYMEHPQRMKSALRGRVLVFSDSNGVSLLGDVVLSRADVPTDWVKLLMLVPAYDAVLERLPYMEMKLSELLNNIQVSQRKRKRAMMAADYELLLNKLLNSLRRCQSDVRRYFGYDSLADLQLVVEEESGPFDISNLGQFLIPASVPGFMVVKFIAENRDKARQKLLLAQIDLDKEESAVIQCKNVLGLESLTKDESVSPIQMTESCYRLLHEIEIGELLKGMRLQITNYYTVMQDGRIAIPWNWGSQA